MGEIKNDQTGTIEVSPETTLINVAHKVEMDLTIRESGELSGSRSSTQLKDIQDVLGIAFDSEHLRGLADGLDIAVQIMLGIYKFDVAHRLPSGKEFLIKEPKGRERIEGRTADIGWDHEAADNFLQAINEVARPILEDLSELEGSSNLK